MNFFTILLLAMAGSAIAEEDHHHKKHVSTDGTLSTDESCMQVAMLSKLVEIAHNQTLLDMKSKGDAAKAAKIQEHANEAESTLKTLESNTTLMATCNVIFENYAMEKRCHKKIILEKLVKMAANETLLENKTKGNATEAAAIKAKAEEAKVKLAQLSGNNTLALFCAAVQERFQCEHMARLVKVISEAKNTTYLYHKYKDDQNKIEEFKAKAAKAEAEITKLQTNSTLAAACPNLHTNTSDASTQSNTTQTPAKSVSITQSGSINVQPAGVMVALAAVFFAGVLLL